MLGMCGKRIGRSAARAGTVLIAGSDPTAGIAGGIASLCGSKGAKAADIGRHRRCGSNRDSYHRDIGGGGGVAKKPWENIGL